MQQTIAGTRYRRILLLCIVIWLFGCGGGALQEPPAVLRNFTAPLA